MPFKFNPFTGNLDFTNNGDVVGPSSSTDNAITRYNGTTGKLVQNSLATVSDEGVGEFQNVVTTNEATANYTIASGKTLTTPFLTISTGVTYSGAGNIFSPGGVYGPGTISISGTLFSE